MKVAVAVVCCLSLVVTVAAVTVREASIAAHNRARRTEAKAEGASNIYELVWDPHLASVAQQWANRCVDEHRNMDDYGENLYYSFPKSQPDSTYLDMAVNWWMDEKSKDNGRFDCCFHDTQDCCHYTQVVSARSRHVGCGVATCSELRQNGRVIGHNAAFVVCFYTPRGNWEMSGHHEAYKTGTPCSACDHGDTCHDGLCVDSA